MKLSIAILSIVFSVAYSQVAYIDTWPANDRTPAGALVVAGYNAIGNGTCLLQLPEPVYWFHVFEGDIVPAQSSAATGLYAISAPHAWQATGNFTFIINFFAEEFNSSQITWSCDVNNQSPISVESFPNNMEQNYTRARITDLDLTNSTKIILTLPDSVDNFNVDAPAMVESVVGNSYTIGNFDGSQTEFRFEFNYLTRWFSASEVSITAVDGSVDELEPEI